MICPKCKKENKDDYKFCYACGADLRVKEDIEDSKVKEGYKDDVKENNKEKSNEDSKLASKEESKDESKEESKEESKKDPNDESKEETKLKKDIDTSKEVPNKFKKLLLYKKNKNDEYVIAKTKVISLIVFVIFFIFSVYVCIISFHFSFANLLTCSIASILIGLIFAVPTYVIGLIIRKLK